MVLFSKPGLIGLDIQPHGVQLVQLQHRGGNRIKHMISEELPFHVFADGKIKHWDVLKKQVTEIVQANRLHGMKVAIHVPAHLVHMQQIQMPMGMLDEEIEADIQQRLKRELPGMTDTLRIDFQVLSQEKGYSDVHFTAVRQEYISQYIECIQEAGLIVSVIDVDIYALARVAGNADAILYLNNHQAIFIVRDANAIIFHQHWDIDESNSVNTQLKQRIQFYLATGAKKLNQIILCGSQNALAIVTLDALQEWDIQLQYLSPFVGVENIVASNDFILACGLAMREASA